MTCFPDTSFLCSLYRKQIHSPRAIEFMKNRTAKLPVSSLLLLEFRQSVRLQVRLHAKDKSKGFPQHEGAQMLKDLQADLAANVLELVSVDWPTVHQRAEELSVRHTEKNGHRLADILHVATALQLGATEFLTFDANQKLLAESEGLQVAPL